MEKIVQFLKTLANSEIFLITLTVVVYYTAQWARQWIKSSLFNPIIVSAIVIISLLHLLGIEFKTYNNANRPINFMLGISVVCLGYLMYKNINNIKEFRYSIITATFLGSIIGVLAVVGLCKVANCNQLISLSLQPKSVTTPIALSLSEIIGGIPALTALSVVITGIFGSVVGPLVLKVAKITDPIAKGVALGSSAHAIGTAKALEIGALEGAIGGASIGLMGLFTSIVIPIINGIIGKI